MSEIKTKELLDVKNSLNKLFKKDIITSVCKEWDKRFKKSFTICIEYSDKLNDSSIYKILRELEIIMNEPFQKEIMCHRSDLKKIYVENGEFDRMFTASPDAFN